MRVNPHLNFNGQCREAFKLYQECLGATVQAMMTWGESPMADQVSAELHDKIIHATLIIGDTELSGVDSPSDRFEAPRGFAVTIQIKEPAEAERVFNALAEGGSVTMPIQQTFWAARFGMLVDRFGIPWMVNCSQPPQD